VGVELTILLLIEVSFNIDFIVLSILIDLAIIDHVKDSYIHDDVFGSDHCPISLDINVKVLF
jgi:exonuclease III